MINYNRQAFSHMHAFAGNIPAKTRQLLQNNTQNKQKLTIYTKKREILWKFCI